MKEKFLFCYKWYDLYSDSKAKKYDSILDCIFTGSRTSSDFISKCMAYDDETAWIKYEKNHTSANITKFVDKMYSMVKELPIE